MNTYYAIHYTDILGGEELGWNFVYDNESEKIVLFSKKETAIKEAEALFTEFRMTEVIDLEISEVDSKGYIVLND